MMKLVISLLLLVCFVSDLVDSRSIIHRPHALKSLDLNATQIQNQRGCSYTVSIRTSCSSTAYTRDQISISFSDAYGNQVYAPRIDDPSTRTFERCSTDTFHINGPCTYNICSLYLYRSGYDGWKPESVTVYGYNTKSVTFYYNVFMPNGIWYGFNHCTRHTSAM